MGIQPASDKRVVNPVSDAEAINAAAPNASVVPDPASGKQNGFPRSARLLTPGTFTAVFEKRSARRGRFFHLHLGPLVNTGDDGGCTAESRLGVAVPKKLLKTAVHRNLLKRIAREIFRTTRAVLPIRDYVLRLSVKLDPKKQALDRSALASDIDALFTGKRHASSPPKITPPAPAAKPGHQAASGAAR